MKSKPETAEMSAKRPSAVLRKQQFLSRPLQDRPSRIIFDSCRWARFGPLVESAAEFRVCDTTCRQKKLLRAPVSSVVI